MTQSDRADSSSLDVNSWGSYPGVKAPERTRTVDSDGIALAVVEWGEESAPILMLAHGGADFARTFDGFAPLLAAGGYRVVSWDHRSHGDSEPAALLSWEADCRDAIAILDSSLAGRPAAEKVYAVGHSKGGGLMTHLSVAVPERFRCLVNIDGIPALGRRPPSTKPVAERVEKRHRWVSSFLDHRRKAHQAIRRPGSPLELVQRRARLNPRLSAEWLQYLATVGARRDADGWRWKLDPLVRMNGLGPWRPEWSAEVISAVTLPMLAILGRQVEAMGWGTTPQEAARTLPGHSELEVYEDSGHFVHIEHPQRTADRVLQFLAKFPSAPERQQSGESQATIRRPRPSRKPTRPITAERTVPLDHGRLQLALHQLSTGPEQQAPSLLCLHELGGSSLQFESSPASGWPGDIWALDLSGHGASDWAPGGGYAPEWSLGDVDAALTHLSGTVDSIALLGRGFGAYIALLAMGARPQLVHFAALVGGAGLLGGGPDPGPPTSITSVPAAFNSDSDSSLSSADPLAIAEFSQDVRPRDYTATFARQVAHLHPRAEANALLPIWIGVPSGEQPPWLEAVAAQCHPASSEAEALLQMGSALADKT